MSEAYTGGCACGEGMASRRHVFAATQWDGAAPGKRKVQA